MTLFYASAAAAAYLLAAVLLWRGRPAGLWSAAVAVALHALALLGEAFHNAHLTVGVTEALSLFAWQAAVLLWMLCLFKPLRILGVAVYPLAAAGVLWAALQPSSLSSIPLTEWKIQLHVVLSLFSAGCLTLAAAQALILAAQDRLLHHLAPGRLLQALPPLETMESALFLLISLGFFTLSLSLVTGLLFVEDLLAQHLAHKTVLSLTAWAIFGALLWGRWQRGWRGRTAIRWTLSGYGLLVMAYFGSKIVLEQLLGKTWT